MKYSLLKTGIITTALITAALPALTFAASLNRQLDLGASGADVSTLQTFLARDSSLYPQGLVTGYFGSLTASAVSRFQTRNGLQSVGRVGPLTLTALNNQIDNNGGGVSNNVSAPAISNIGINRGTNTATVSWNTNVFAKGVVYYSTTPLTTYEYTNSVTVSGATAMSDTALHTSQSVSLSGLQANTTYYYLIYTTDQAGNVSVTWPSTFQTTN